MKDIYKITKFIMLLPIIGCFLCASLLLLLSLFKGYYVFFDFITLFFSGTGYSLLSVQLIEIVDIFLLATVVYIVFLGLYELFIDPNIQTPEWLHIRSLDDLKKKLISALVIVMAVYFISVLENSRISSEEMSVIAFGISLMTFSMTYFLSKK